MALILEEGYKEFFGKNATMMPQLRNFGKVLSIADIMERRLNSSISEWKDNYFQTIDAVVYHPNGNIKIVLDAKPLLDMDETSHLNNGALAISEKLYEGLAGQEFQREDFRLSLGKDTSEVNVKNNPIWQCVSRNQALLNEYVEKTFFQMKTFFLSEKNMGIYFHSSSKLPLVRCLSLYNLENKSQLWGFSGLNCGSGRLVGR